MDGPNFYTYTHCRPTIESDPLGQKAYEKTTSWAEYSAKRRKDIADYAAWQQQVAYLQAFLARIGAEMARIEGELSRLRAELAHAESALAISHMLVGLVLVQDSYDERLKRIKLQARIAALLAEIARLEARLQVMKWREADAQAALSDLLRNEPIPPAPPAQTPGGHWDDITGGKYRRWAGRHRPGVRTFPPAEPDWDSMPITQLELQFRSEADKPLVMKAQENLDVAASMTYPHKNRPTFWTEGGVPR